MTSDLPPIPVSENPPPRPPALLQAVNSLVAALWVAICAATPEFIWRGAKAAGSHLNLGDAVAAILVGLILAFCIEPSMERFRHRWIVPTIPGHRASAKPAASDPDHDPGHAYSLMFRAAVGLAFAIASVCLHDAITVFLASHAADEATRRAGLAAGLKLAGAWTVVPFCVTLAWLAGTRGKGRWLCAVLAAASPLAAAYVFSWTLAEWLTTELPAIGILAWGYRQWPRGSVATFFRRTGPQLLWLCPACPVIAWLLGVIGNLTGLHGIAAYTPAESWIDARFYLGWVIGLILAPVPLPERPAPRTDIATAEG